MIANFIVKLFKISVDFDNCLIKMQFFDYSLAKI